MSGIAGYAGCGELGSSNSAAIRQEMIDIAAQFRLLPVSQSFEAAATETASTRCAGSGRYLAQ
jgi:hypothetical protein